MRTEQLAETAVHSEPHFDADGQCDCDCSACMPSDIESGRDEMVCICVDCNQDVCSLHASEPVTDRFSTLDRGGLLRECRSLAAAVAAATELHFTRGRNILGQPVCAECSPLQPMPCPTLRALGGVQEDSNAHRQ